MAEIVRYSDKELEEFRVLIEEKLSRTQEQLENLQEQILEITENSDDEYGSDWMDDSSINDNLEMLNNMAIRQRKYLRDLENAQVRIRNKTYGICEVSGELIDKRRLLAVPTTTKSVQAKNAIQQQATGEEEEKPKAVVKRPEKPKIITKVIRKPSPSKPTPKPIDEHDLELDENFDELIGFDEEEETEDDFKDVNVDWDTVADSDTGADDDDDDRDY